MRHRIVKQGFGPESAVISTKHPLTKPGNGANPKIPANPNKFATVLFLHSGLPGLRGIYIHVIGYTGLPGNFKLTRLSTSGCGTLRAEKLVTSQ